MFYFNSEPLIWKSHETTIVGLDLVPSNSQMELAEHFLKSRNNCETILRDSINESIRRIPLKRARIRKGKGLSSLKTRSGGKNSPPAQETTLQFDIKRLGETPPTIEYDIVILDCPPALGAVTLNALVAADLLIIPMQPEYFSVHSLKTILPAIREVRNKYNPNLAYRVLITLYDRRNRIHQNFTRQLQQTCWIGGSQNDHRGRYKTTRECSRWYANYRVMEAKPECNPILRTGTGVNPVCPASVLTEFQILLTLKIPRSLLTGKEEPKKLIH